MQNVRSATPWHVAVGEREGGCVGFAVGLDVGIEDVGMAVGSELVGLRDGDNEGLCVGEAEHKFTASSLPSAQ